MGKMIPIFNHVKLQEHPEFVMSKNSCFAPTDFGRCWQIQEGLPKSATEVILLLMSFQFLYTWFLYNYSLQHNKQTRLWQILAAQLKSSKVRRGFFLNLKRKLVESKLTCLHQLSSEIIRFDRPKKSFFLWEGPNIFMWQRCIKTYKVSSLF